MIYRILGELAIEVDGVRLPLPTGHHLMVLTALLVNANRRMSTGALLRAGWGDADVNPTQLHKSVSTLRRVMAPLGRQFDLVTLPGHGYQLRVAEEDMDKLVFDRLIRDADEAAAEGRNPDEVDLLWRALRLWTGPHPLAGIPGDTFQHDAAHLAQRRKRVAVRLFDIEIGRGRGDRVIDELYLMVDRHPTDRRLCEQLMLALYRGGHRTDAVAVYDRHAAALDEEAGARPESDLRSLMYAISHGDEQVIAQYETETPTRPVPVPRQLPADIADLVGREATVAAGIRLLDREARGATPVVVITGPGGIGKTILAIHIAHLVRDRYPDGQLYVELADTAAQHLSAEEVLAHLLRGLGVIAIPETRADRVALYRTLTSQRRFLLVFDDARDEAQIRELVPANPGCGVLITARRRLPDIDGAFHLPTLAPLEPAEADALFARAVIRCGVDPLAEPGATRRVVELCAGLPLAIAIAAALRGRDPGRTTADLADRLARQRLDGFVYGDRSVALTIGVGFDRLDPEARILFLGLGLLPLPEFGLWTAAAILDGTGADPAETLLRLAGWHMIQPSGSGMRYRFHDLTREFARHRAEVAYPVHARPTVLRGVYAALLSLVRRAHRGIYRADFDLPSSSVPDWPAPSTLIAELDRDPLSWYEIERRNIRAAVRHAAELGLHDECWDLAVSSHEFYTLRGYHDDWHATHIVALDACRAAGNLKGEAAVLVTLGQPALVASHRSDAPSVADLNRAAVIFAQLGDHHGEAIALRTLANGLRRLGQLSQAMAAFTKAAQLYEQSGDPVGSWQSLRYIGQTHLELGDADEALRVLRTARRAAQKTDRPRLLAQTAYWIGHAHLARGEISEAEVEFQYVLELIGNSDSTGRAYATHGLGEVALRAGGLDKAEALLRTAATLIGTTPSLDAVLDGRVHRSLAELFAMRDWPTEEAEALRYAAGCFGRGNAPHLRAQTLAALASSYHDHGAIDDARAAWTEALASFVDLGLPEAGAIAERLAALG